MHMIKIGILDDEQEYVTMLAAYLGRYGRGRWTTAAFTDKGVLSTYLSEGQLDIVAGTDREELRQLQQTYENLIFLWLSNRQKSEEREMGFYEVYRYQSVWAIGKMVEEITTQIIRNTGLQKTMAAIYSPVGRCGKTTLALEVAKKEDYGKWIYIGLEDYSSFLEEREGDEDTGADDFFYYIKERQAEKLLSVVKSRNGIIFSGSSFFDTRQINYEDLEWLKGVLQEWDCSGIICDIGTGILTDLELLSLFDYILVPYLKGEISMIKKQNFEQMLAFHGYDWLQEKMILVNMSNQEEIEEKKKELFGGKMV